MKISKLFHWLYAILMFLPFGLLLFNALASMWSGQVIDESAWLQYISLSNVIDFFQSGPSASVYNVYSYLLADVFGLSPNSLYDIIVSFLTYWTCISIIWLVFDVFMYVPLLVHRWIDKAKIE